MNKYVWILLFCIGCVVGIYSCQFGSNGFSDDTASWGVFGDYIGGCCNVIVAILALFIMRKWGQKDKKDEDARNTIKIIFEQVCKICNNNYNANMVNKLFREIESGRLFLSPSLYEELTDLGNYFLTVNNGDRQPNPDKEERVKRQLKDSYDK